LKNKSVSAYLKAFVQRLWGCLQYSEDLSLNSSE